MKRLKIVTDDDARSPREECENADVMYCEHSRYNLGDKDADKPVHEASFVTLAYLRPDGTSATYVLDDSDNDHELHLLYDDVLDMLEAHMEELAEELADATDDTSALTDADTEELRTDAVRAADGYNYLRNASWESEYRLNPGIAIIRPLSLYDHSGITIFAGAPTCRWDSGQVGWQYVTEAALQAEWKGDRDKALAYMDATLEVYDHYIRGNCYGFIVEACTAFKKTYPNGHIEDGYEWEQTDSCWGFIGDWDGKDDPTGIGDHLDNDVRELFNAMDYNDLDEWQYTPDVPEDARED